MNNLKDQVILVTGAGDGIGKAVSLALAKQGATLILLGRTARKLEAVYDLIESAGGAQPVIIPLDLKQATPIQYNEIKDQIEATFGQLHGLLHNAARLGSLTPVEHYPVLQWAEVFGINLIAPLLLTQTLLPLLKKAPRANIVCRI